MQQNTGNRQQLHEKIRQLSMEAGRHVKEEGKENNLLELIAADETFPLELEELQKAMEPRKYTGRAASQVERYLDMEVLPVLEENREYLGLHAEIAV